MIKIIIFFLLLFILILLLYIFYLTKQIKSINNQIENRINDKSILPISLELFNKDLNTLVSNFNNALIIEENLRNQIINNENNFKNMIANISHDLRTPLTSIKGYIQLLDKSILDSEQKEMINTSLNHANNLENLITDFFELSYLEISKPKLEMKRLNLTNIVSNNIVDYIYEFEKNNLSVTFKDSNPAYIYGDENYLNRIIQNLIKNCILHSNGDIEVNILTKEKVILSFKNRINNYDELNVEDLFNRFYSSDKSLTTSTGLGLSIVKILTEKMNGSVSAYLENDVLDIQISLEKYI